MPRKREFHTESTARARIPACAGMTAPSLTVALGCGFAPPALSSKHTELESVLLRTCGWETYHSLMESEKPLFNR